MARHKKKRNKKYTGADAANAAPSIVRVKAVKKSKSRLWWEDHKRIIKIGSITFAVIFLIIVLIAELFRAF